jgi:hypothetical protein
MSLLLHFRYGHFLVVLHPSQPICPFLVLSRDKIVQMGADFLWSAALVY